MDYYESFSINHNKKPLWFDSDQQNVRKNITALNKFKYIQPQPVTIKSNLKMASRSPDYFHYHYMQNLRRQHEKISDDEATSALRGPTKYQILGKPVSDVEISILEDLQRQTKNFTLDETKPVTEQIELEKKKLDSSKKKNRDNIERKSKREQKKSTTSVKKNYKETFEETRPSLDKSGRHRTIKTQKTMSFSTTIKPFRNPMVRKRKTIKGLTKHNDDDIDVRQDSVEASDTKKVFMTTSIRSKGVNKQAYAIPNDDYYPVNDNENYSLEWDDKYNVRDFVIRRNGEKVNLKPKNKKVKMSGEIPILDVYGGGTFDRSKEENEYDDYYDSNNPFDVQDSSENASGIIKKNFQ